MEVETGIREGLSQQSHKARGPYLRSLQCLLYTCLSDSPESALLWNPFLRVLCILVTKGSTRVWRIDEVNAPICGCFMS